MNIFRPLAYASALLLIANPLQAQTGVSDDRVSLPEGPGSLEGVGENVDLNANMGSMSYGVPIQVPRGFGALTPALRFGYSSGAGNSVVGMGWTMDTPYVERMTYRGLPEYDTDDDFAVNGSDQLVRLPGTEPAVYRSRYEGSFERMTWVNAGNGQEGYWLGESDGGVRSYYGADAGGNLVGSARVAGPNGTFRYMLVEQTDPYDHRVVYTYTRDGAVALISRIGYVYADGQNPTYEVTFTYEDRSDDSRPGYADVLSDAKGGFDELLTQRVARVDVISRGITIRSYRTSYEPYATSGGFTRLNRIETLGLTGETYPIVFDFEYSGGLGQQTPYVRPMGNLGVNLAAGMATLIDITGDGLPDVLDTTDDGAHRFYVNTLSDGYALFNEEPTLSNVGTGSAFRLNAPGTQVLDVDGDGFTDLLNATTGQVLMNKGNGDWEQNTTASGTTDLAAAFASDFSAEDGELQTMKFMDYNGDKRIDVVRSTQDTTTIYQNLGIDGFEIDEDVASIGAGFAEEGLQFSDMNGDSLLDVVRVRAGSIQYKLNYGWGQWSDDWTIINGLPITDAEVELAELEDINGDGLSDLVVVTGNSVKYALNTNVSDFDDAETIVSSMVDGEIPSRDSGTTVLYADMNANGSSDIVWIDSGGVVNVLELFPVRPNLLTRITNGIGMVTDISYGSSVEEQARDEAAGQPWATRLPHPMLVVTERDRYDLLTDLHERDIYTYHDGFYDGDEKQFRGYARVERSGPSDSTQEERFVEMVYAIGTEDPYRKGLLLHQTIQSGNRPLQETITTYEECPLAEIPEGTELPIKYICPTRVQTILKEDRPESEWVHLESRNAFDGYGNVIFAQNFGVVGLGPDGSGSCAPCETGSEQFGAPCGAQCLGDEMYTETDFITPGDNTEDRWFISSPYRVRSYGDPVSDLVSERLTYYDGPDFEGLPLGQLSQGNTTRTTVKREVGSDAVIEAVRNAFDIHGNVIDTLDPLGTSDGHTHRRQYTYDDEGLRVVQADILLEDNEGQPYRLRREVLYEPLFDKPTDTTTWMRVVGDEVISTRRAWTMTYDMFGRMLSRSVPGNLSQDPDQSFEYDLASPASRIITRSRSEVGGDMDLVSIRCLDGRGRSFQQRTRLAQNSYQVTGYTRYNLRSTPVEVFQPYLGSSEECDTASPEDVLSTTYRYDALGRVLESTLPDAALYGGVASNTQMVYGPLFTQSFDPEDTDPSSPHVGTPRVTHTNGLGQTVSIERLLAVDDGATIELRYDGLGRLTHVVDPQGNTKEQFYDLLGRVTRIIDPNSANDATYDYDDASNLLRETDDRSITTVTEYDGMNRPVATFDADDRDGTLIETIYDVNPSCSTQLCSNVEGRAARVTYPGLDGERAIQQFGFDQRDRMVYRAHILAGVSFETTFVYDNADRAIATTYPNGQTISRSYDDANRLIAIDGIVNTITYDQRSQPISVAHADGTEATMNYDDLMRVSERLTANGSGLILQGMSYQHDRVGNILAIDDLTEASMSPSYQSSFQYDAWYRVAEANLGQGNDSKETVSYGFDLLDNITSRNSTSADSVANIGDLNYDSYAPNAVTSTAGLVFGYDEAGHMIEHGDTTFTWDFMGRMTSASTSSGDPARMTYGPNQSRVARQDVNGDVLYPSRTFEVRDGISTLYIKVGLNRVARIESDELATTLIGDPIADDQVNVADAFASRQNGSDAMLRTTVRRLLLEVGPDNGVTHLHGDHLTSITLATGIVDGQATVLGQRAFDMLGSERPDSWGYVDEYGFTGQELDRSTGMIHFDWRYLDPRLGRWLSIDPLFATSTPGNIGKLGESTTAYAYVAGNFSSAIDPTGLGGWFKRNKNNKNNNNNSNNNSNNSNNNGNDEIVIVIHSSSNNSNNNSNNGNNNASNNSASNNSAQRDRRDSGSLDLGGGIPNRPRIDSNASDSMLGGGGGSAVNLLAGNSNNARNINNDSNARMGSTVNTNIQAPINGGLSLDNQGQFGLTVPTVGSRVNRPGDSPFNTATGEGQTFNVPPSFSVDGPNDAMQAIQASQQASNTAEGQ